MEIVRAKGTTSSSRDTKRRFMWVAKPEVEQQNSPWPVGWSAALLAPQDPDRDHKLNTLGDRNRTQAGLEKISGRFINNFGLNLAQPQNCGRWRLNRSPTG